METRVGGVAESEERRRGREEEEGLGLGFGSGSTSPLHPQKMIRTSAFPFRMAVPTPSSNPTGFYYSGSYDSYDPARALQPFPSPFKAAGVGGGTAATRGFPFTSAQWQELQRQALIYKHIVASVPVPPDLLLPSSARAFPEAPPHFIPTHTVAGRGSACFNMRFSGSADPEPGRCRRTDGKKWRCSRDVAPGQKYCERHVHRGRPRSRKPVEQNKTKPTSTTTTTTTTTTTKTTTAPTTALATNTSATILTTQSPGFFPKPDLKLPFQYMELTKEPRYFEANHEWDLMHLKMGLRSNGDPAVIHHYEDQLSLNFPDVNGHYSCPFLNPDLSSLEGASIADHRDPPRRFIDAWSNENPVTSAADYKPSSVGKLPLSTLTLSMSGFDEVEADEIEMGLALSDAAAKSQSSSWMDGSSPFGGGPLAEVLHSSNVTSPHHGGGSGSSKSSCGGLINLMGSKGCCESLEGSPRESPTRLASSPSGVLHKALVSLSDSSSSSSPTFAAASRPSIALQWMNHPK